MNKRNLAIDDDFLGSIMTQRDTDHARPGRTARVRVRPVTTRRYSGDADGPEDLGLVAKVLWR